MFLCRSVCYFLYGPFCHVALKLDISSYMYIVYNILSLNISSIYIIYLQVFMNTTLLNKFCTSHLSWCPYIVYIMFSLIISSIYITECDFIQLCFVLDLMFCYLQLSHIYAGTWGLAQEKISSIDFGYLE